MRPANPTAGRSLSVHRVRRLLQEYSPNVVPPEEWRRVAPFVTDILERFPYSSEGTLRHDLLQLTEFAVMCVRRGFPLEHRTVLVPELVDAFLAERVAAGRWARRTSFERWGRALTDDARWRPTPSRGMQRRLFQPYEEREIERYWRLAHHQSTPLRRRTAVTMIASCAGAGLTSGEYMWAQARDVKRVDGYVVVAVGDPYPRDVPVRRRFAAALADVAQRLYADEYLHGRNPCSWSSASQMSHRLDEVDGCRVNALRPIRLRHTWMRELLDDGVPLADIARAAGRFSDRTIEGALPVLRRSPNPDYFRLIAGTSGV